MDHRFGFRDLLVCALLVLLLVAVGLAMVQYDRQWDQIQAIRSQLRELTGDTARIRQMIERGEGIRAPRGETAEADPDAARGTETSTGPEDRFERLRQLQARPDYARGDTLVRAFAQPPDRLTPIISSDAYASAIQGYVLESLAERHPETLEWEPLIARDWETVHNLQAWQAYIDRHLGEPVTENAVRGEEGYTALEGNEEAQTAYLERRLEEGRRREEIIRDPEAPPAVTLRFHLRRGVQFSDGEPLTADDVVFTYHWIMNPEVEAIRLRVYYEPIRSVEKIDKHTVAFHFREPYFRAFDFAAGMQILPEHFYSRFEPSEFNQHPALLLGSGPYRLPSPEGERPRPGVPIELVRNPRYWGEAPAFDALVWRVIEQDSSREQAFLNREIDGLSASPEQYDRLRENEKLMERAQRFEYLSPSSGYNYIGWNQSRGGEPTPFADARVRRAMTLLLDRQRIAEEVYRGYARVATGPFNPLGRQANPEIEPLPYDPEQGQRLLAEAGYRDRNGDGVLQTPDGAPFVVTLNTPAGSETYQQVAMFVRDSYRRAGIDFRVKPLEWQVLIERLKQTRDFDAVALGWTGSLEGDPFQIFHSSTIPPPGDNATSYANPELDQLIEKARMALDEEKRFALWHQVHRILHEDQPYTFMMVGQNLSFYDGRIRNIHRTRLGLTPVTEWYVPAEHPQR